MDKLLDLPVIQALSASDAYGGQRLLSGDTCVLLLGWLTYMMNYDLWQGAGYELTDNEKDEIAAMVAGASDDLMEAVNVGNYTLLDSVTYTEDTSEIEIDNLDCSDYDAIEIFLYGLKTNYVSRWADDIRLIINDVVTGGKYTSYAAFKYAQSLLGTNFIEEDAGFRMANSATGLFSDNEVFSSTKITIFQPGSEAKKNMLWQSSIPNDVTNLLGVTSGQGFIAIEEPIEKITIMPAFIATFKIDDEDAEFPDFAKISVYGVG